MKTLFTPIILSLLIPLSSCGLLEDTAIDPIYFLECEVDGTHYKAETANNTSLLWFAGPEGDAYTISGQHVPKDFNVSLSYFKSLGEGKLMTGINVNSYITTISYFTDNKTYISSDGSGCMNLDLLTDEMAEGTFEGILENLDDPTDLVELTNGKFKVKEN